FSAIFSLSLFYYPATPPRYILSLHDALPIFSQRFPKLWTLHNRIHKSVLHQEFCPLESFGKFLSDGLLNDSWTCETDQRAGLCQDDISHHGETCGLTSCREVSQHRYIEKPCNAVAF